MVLLRPKGLGKLGKLGSLGTWVRYNLIQKKHSAVFAKSRLGALGQGAALGRRQPDCSLAFSSPKCYYLRIAPARPLVLGAALRLDAREGAEVEAVDLLAFLGIGASAS